jgi:hypothetical protein
MLSIQTNSYAYNRKMIFPIDRWLCSISDYGFGLHRTTRSCFPS